MPWFEHIFNHSIRSFSWSLFLLMRLLHRISIVLVHELNILDAKICGFPVCDRTKFHCEVYQVFMVRRGAVFRMILVAQVQRAWVSHLHHLYSCTSRNRTQQRSIRPNIRGAPYPFVIAIAGKGSQPLHLPAHPHKIDGLFLRFFTYAAGYYYS